MEYFSTKTESKMDYFQNEIEKKGTSEELKRFQELKAKVDRLFLAYDLYKSKNGGNISPDLEESFSDFKKNFLDNLLTFSIKNYLKSRYSAEKDECKLLIINESDGEIGHQYTAWKEKYKRERDKCDSSAFSGFIEFNSKSISEILDFFEKATNVEMDRVFTNYSDIRAISENQIKGSLFTITAEQKKAYEDEAKIISSLPDLSQISNINSEEEFYKISNFYYESFGKTFKFLLVINEISKNYPNIKNQWLLGVLNKYFPEEEFPSLVDKDISFIYEVFLKGKDETFRGLYFKVRNLRTSFGIVEGIRQIKEESKTIEALPDIPKISNINNEKDFYEISDLYYKYLGKTFGFLFFLSEVSQHSPNIKGKWLLETLNKYFPKEEFPLEVTRDFWKDKSEDFIALYLQAHNLRSSFGIRQSIEKTKSITEAKATYISVGDVEGVLGYLKYFSEAEKKGETFDFDVLGGSSAGSVVAILMQISKLSNGKISLARINNDVSSGINQLLKPKRGDENFKEKEIDYYKNIAKLLINLLEAYLKEIGFTKTVDQLEFSDLGTNIYVIGKHNSNNFMINSGNVINAVKISVNVLGAGGEFFFNGLSSVDTLGEFSGSKTHEFIDQYIGIPLSNISSYWFLDGARLPQHGRKIEVEQ